MKTNTITDFITIVKKISKNTNGCLLWPRTKNNNGYGAYKINNKRILVHRLIWQALKSQIPEGLCVMHKCDIANCINIQHLQLGTRADNNKDRALKGRSATGEKSGKAKLTEEEVRDIRLAYKSNKFTHRQLGRKFNISNHQVSQIVTRKSWSHIV